MTLLLQHSPDGVNWAAFPYWIDAVSFSGNTMYRVDNSAFTLSTYFRRLYLGVVGDPGAAARVRIWATSRGRSMRRLHEQVFDQFVFGTTAVYTDESVGWLLASSDKLLLFAIVDEVSGGTPELTVQLQESPDGQTWSNKSGTAEIDGVTLVPSFTNKILGQDLGTAPTSAFVRLKITLGTTSPAAQIKLFVTGWGP